VANQMRPASVKSTATNSAHLQRIINSLLDAARPANFAGPWFLKNRYKIRK